MNRRGFLRRGAVVGMAGALLGASVGKAQASPLPGSVVAMPGSLMSFHQPLSFEQMVDACVARGCLLDAKTVDSDESDRLITHVQTYADGVSRWAGFDYRDRSANTVLAEVDLWRRGLHSEV